MAKKESAEKAVRDIRRKTRRRFSAEEKIRIVIEGLRGEESIASLCRRVNPPESHGAGDTGPTNAIQ
jgi:transposase